MNVNITFLGGSGTVTGSKYLVRYNGKSLLWLHRIPLARIKKPPERSGCRRFLPG